MQDGVCHFAIGDDGGAALFCCSPGGFHLGCHAPAPALTLVPKLDVTVQLWAVGVNDPAHSILLSKADLEMMRADFGTEGSGIGVWSVHAKWHSLWYTQRAV